MKSIRYRSAIAAALLLTATGGARADDSVTMNGITLYGTVDVGVSYQSHGNPFNDLAATNVNNFLTKANNRPNLSLASNGLGISTIGVKGAAQIDDELAAIFKAETGFLPASGQLIDGPGSIARNNGVALTSQSAYGDSNKAGQALNGRVFVGLASQHYGTLTVGRNSTVLSDNVCEYDALSCSLNFSYIGFFGATGGSGDTQDRFLDNTVKYDLRTGPVRIAALYQFPVVQDASGHSNGDAWQVDLGTSWKGFSMDGLVGVKKDAILVPGPLSAAQIAGFLTPGSPTAGLSSQNTLPAIISDNLSYSLMASLDVGPKLFAGYEHMEYDNPGAPLPVGAMDIGGYRLIPNNSNFPHPKQFQIAWFGVRYGLTERLDLMGAGYFGWQNSYGAKDCSDRSAPTCSGSYDALSAVLDYHFTKKFDLYGGLQWSHAADGMASGFLQNASYAPMVGVRFSF